MTRHAVKESFNVAGALDELLQALKVLTLLSGVHDIILKGFDRSRGQLGTCRCQHDGAELVADPMVIPRCTSWRRRGHCPAGQGCVVNHRALRVLPEGIAGKHSWVVQGLEGTEQLTLFF